MKKTLSLLLALVMVIGLFPVFADEAKVLTAEEAGAILQGYGAIKGGSDGDLMIDKELKRQDAVVILTRLMGKETDALATQAAPSFEDITIDYYKPFLAFAEANKWVEGKKEKTFGFNDVTTVKEFAAMLLRALGHDTTGENYPKVMELAKELKLFNGATVEENAPIVRGIAFILMNNTLETAPKGEDKALVYKLGYKEEPKPQGFVVTEAKAAGRKAIDLTFTKPVDEKTLKGRVSITENKKRIDIDSNRIYVSKEGTEVRLVLVNTAKQDAHYTVKVNGVKAADGKETVEKFEGTVIMTDTVRPEVLSVEAINPKTLLVKTSEPINKDTMIYAETLKEIKIDGKAQLVKVVNDYRNEIVVELQKALAAGNYKVEISGLKDFDGLIAKTMEFDVTVVEDKEAPVVVEATMLTIEKIKVTFDEPVKNAGSYKVNGKEIKPSQVKVKATDNRVVEINLTKDQQLDMGAVVEVAVQYKGQKDAMNNMVKDWTKFTFKVVDDTEIPTVESVSVDGTTVVVEFSKNMLKEGKFAIKDAKNNVKLSGKATPALWDSNDDSVLYIEASFLNANDGMEYTLVLEGFKDGTPRKNELGKTEVKFTSEDLKSPSVHEYYTFYTSEGYLHAKLYFSEEMDASRLLESKNVTFMGYKHGTSAAVQKRADSVKVELSADDNGKVLVVSAYDKNIKAFGNIRITGMADLAGNTLPETLVKPNDAGLNAQKVKEKGAVLRRDEDNNGFVVAVTFKNMLKGDIAEGETGIFKLVKAGPADVTNLKFIGLSADKYTAYFDVVDDAAVTNEAKSTDGGAALSLALVNGDKAKDVFENPASAVDVSTSADAVIQDKVAPRLTDAALQKDGKFIKLGADLKSILAGEEIFDEAVTQLSGYISGDNFQATVTANGKSMTLNVTTGVFESGKTYNVTITDAKDAANNVLTGSFTLDPVFELADYVSIEPVFDAGKTQIEAVRIKFDAPVAVNFNAANFEVKIAEDGTPKAPGATTGATLENGDKDVKVAFTTPVALTSTKTYEVSIKVDGDKITDKTYTTAKIINLTHEQTKMTYVHP